MTTPTSSIPGGQSAFSACVASGHGTKHTLIDLIYDGFYALFMLKNGNGQQANAHFINKITQLLDDLAHGAKKTKCFDR